MTLMTASTFVTIGPSHVAMLALFVAGIWPVVALGRAQRGAADPRRASRWFAVAIMAFTVPMQIVDFMPGQYAFDTTLPLQLCDFAWIAAVVALLTHHRFFVALTYFWGLVLTTQGLLTPWLTADFPNPKYIGFWGMHILIVWAAIHLTWGLGLRPAWRDYASTVAATATWAVSVFTFNAVTGTNYGFLNRKPSTGSLLDHLGPWPSYVVLEVLIVASVWALMTWPWVARGQRDGAASIAAC
ncbi:TIGR02206 family membrane protein [Nocardioides sp. JQ2195]|uniref:YwaF family protein n=1 Tax=Nocardioides sp. JQ2195 TaxID=2592334 RepID=UPI00197F17A5|nr:TIGR02206 family membrane protein [Nocardioides sp. JQ2195]